VLDVPLTYRFADASDLAELTLEFRRRVDAARLDVIGAVRHRSE